MSTDLRNRRITDEDLLIHLFDHSRRSVWVDDSERAAYAETTDVPPTYGAGLYYGEGEPATEEQTRGFIGALIGFTLLGAAIAYLLWAGSHGGFPWQ